MRGLVRPTSARAPDLARLGVENVAGDLKDRASLEAACRDADAVITTVDTCLRQPAAWRFAGPRGPRRPLALVDAARSRGVRRFIFVSVSPNLRPTCEFVRIKRQVEAAVRESGMDWVNLQPSSFMEIWLSPLMSWDLARGRARIFGSGHAPASFVSFRDVAAFAARAADDPRLKNRDLPIGRPEALSPLGIVRVCEDITRKPFRVQRLPVPLLRTLSAVLRPFAPVPSSLMDMGVQMAERGDPIDSGAMAQELGIRPTSVREFIARRSEGKTAG